MTVTSGLGGCGPRPLDRRGNLEKRLFPLPPVVVPSRMHARTSCSRRSSQVDARRVRTERDVAEVVEALNWLHDGRVTDGGDAPTTPNFCQAECLESVRSRIRITSSGLPDVSPRAAFDALLRGRSVYTVGQAPVALASFSEGVVSLPVDLVNSPEVVDLLPGTARRFLEEPERMMRSADELAVLREETVIKPYSDKELMSCEKKYCGFVEHLSSIGLLEYTTSPLAFSGIFFCKKEGAWAVADDPGRSRSKPDLRPPPRRCIVYQRGPG